MAEQRHPRDTPGDQRTPVSVERSVKISICEVPSNPDVGDRVIVDVVSGVAPEPEDLKEAVQAG